MVFSCAQFADKGVESRREDQAEAGHSKHSKQHGCSREDCRISAPAPAATARGATPRMKAKDVHQDSGGDAFCAAAVAALLGVGHRPGS